MIDNYFVVKVLLCVFICGFLILYLGYIIGKQKGILLGMEQFISIIKVYDPDLAKEIGNLLNKVSDMPNEERAKIFESYIEKYDKQD